MSSLTLQDAVSDLYYKARTRGATTSTARLSVLAELRVQELGERGMPGALIDPQIPGFAREKDWDVAWFHNGKARLAISLKSLLTNLSGTVPNRIDDLMGEVANLQMYSPETAIGYVMLFNIEEDGLSKKHGVRGATYFASGSGPSLAGRRRTGQSERSRLRPSSRWTSRAGRSSYPEPTRFPVMFDTLVGLVRERNPDLRPGTMPQTSADATIRTASS